MPVDPMNEKPPMMQIEMVAILESFPCSDPGCELDASVFITTESDKKSWCTGHAHCEISVWMVGL